MADEQQPPLSGEALPSLTDEAQQVWEAAKGAIDNVFERPISPQEFYYLLSCHPYLEICDADNPYVDDTTPPKVYQAKSGWTIIDYGSLLATGHNSLSARELAMRHKQELEAGEEEEGSEGGTMSRQMLETVFELIQIAMRNGWNCSEIVSGFYPMQRLAWIAAAENNFAIKGFNPTSEDRVVQNWVMKLRDKKFYPGTKPIFIPTDSAGRRVG